MSETPRGDSPDDPDKTRSTIRRPRLFASGRDEDQQSAGPPETAGQDPTEEAPAEHDPGEPGLAGIDPGERPPAIELAESGPEDEATRRRKRRITVIAVCAGAAVIIIALCAGGLGIVSAVHNARSNAADAQAARNLREADCLELETRLNHLIPPGATSTPAARATAVQDENSAVRIYLGRLRDQTAADAWRQLVDARTTYAQSLQEETKTRTPAFFVAPRASDGAALTDQLAQTSPAQCAGSIRRLAQPDL